MTSRQFKLWESKVSTSQPKELKLLGIGSIIGFVPKNFLFRLKIHAFPGK